MSKYNSNAGFKNYDVPSEEENEEVVGSPLSKYKTGLIFGGIAVVALVIIVAIMMLVVSNSDSDEEVTDATSQVEVASYDYNELFEVETTEDLDDSTIPNPYEGIHNKKPQMTTQPTSTTPAQNNNSNNNNSTNNSNNNSNNSNNGNSGGGNNSGGSSNNNSSSNNSGNSGGSGNSGNSGNSGSGSSGNSGNSGSKSSGSSGSSGSTPKTPKKSTPTPAPKPQNIAVTGVSISPRSITIKKGSSTSLTVSVSPSNATNKSITWMTSNSAIATVSGGKVTGVSAGKANIIAMSNNGTKALCEVTVTNPQPVADNVSLSPSSQTIKKGSALTIRLNGASKCSWSFSNPFVTNTISSSNTSITIKGAKAGMTNVIATLSNGKTYKSKITVQ